MNRTRPAMDGIGFGGEHRSRIPKFKSQLARWEKFLVLDTSTVFFLYFIIRFLCIAAVIAVFRIRIRIGSEFNEVSGFVSGFGSRRAKMTHKNRKNEEISCFEVLDGLF
jgi:hypothetical protein